MLGTLQDTSHGLAQVILTDLIIIPTVQPRKLRLRGIKSFCSRSHINWEAEPGRKPVCAAPQDFGQITRLTPPQFIPESLKHLPQACSELGSEHHVGILMLLSFFRDRDIQDRTSETHRTFHHLRLASPVHRGWNTSLQHGANRLIYWCFSFPKGKTFLFPYLMVKTSNSGILSENCWSFEGETDFWFFGFHRP